MRARPGVVVGTAVAGAALLLAGCGGPSTPATTGPGASTSATSPAAATTPPASASSRRPAYSKVLVIPMENKTEGQVIGSPQAPYLTMLAARYGTTTNMDAGYPGLPVAGRLPADDQRQHPRGLRRRRPAGPSDQRAERVPAGGPVRPGVAELRRVDAVRLLAAEQSRRVVPGPPRPRALLRQRTGPVPALGRPAGQCVQRRAARRRRGRPAAGLRDGHAERVQRHARGRRLLG